MTIHSVALNAAARRPRPGNPNTPPGAKRDAILRGAIDVFAERGYFNAQVADVARAAGIAAGTVYLYFKSKDDLLVSIFERSMRDGLAEGRTAVAAGPTPPTAPPPPPPPSSRPPRPPSHTPHPRSSRAPPLAQ